MQYAPSRNWLILLLAGMLVIAIVNLPQTLAAQGLPGQSIESILPGQPAAPGQTPGQDVPPDRSDQQGPPGLPEGPPPLPSDDQPVPPPLPAIWYAGIGGQPIGPLTIAEISDMIDEGRITRSTLVWTSGMANWMRAGDVPEIAALFDRNGQAVAPPDGVGGNLPPEFDPAAFLAGTWRNASPLTFDGMTAQGEIEAVYSPDNRLNAGGTLTITQMGVGSFNMSIRVTGTWSAEPISETRFALTTDATLTMSIPSLGLSDTANSRDTSVIFVVDRNSFRDTENVLWVRVR